MGRRGSMMPTDARRACTLRLNDSSDVSIDSEFFVERLLTPRLTSIGAISTTWVIINFFSIALQICVVLKFLLFPRFGSLSLVCALALFSLLISLANRSILRVVMLNAGWTFDVCIVAALCVCDFVVFDDIDDALLWCAVAVWYLSFAAGDCTIPSLWVLGQKFKIDVYRGALIAIATTPATFLATRLLWELKRIPESKVVHVGPEVWGQRMTLHGTVIPFLLDMMIFKVIASVWGRLADAQKGYRYTFSSVSRFMHLEHDE